METLVIKSSDRNQLDEIKKILSDMKVKVLSLSEDEIEDIGLGLLIKEAESSGWVDRDDVLKKLDSI